MALVAFTHVGPTNVFDYANEECCSLIGLGRVFIGKIVTKDVSENRL